MSPFATQERTAHERIKNFRRGIYWVSCSGHTGTSSVREGWEYPGFPSRCDYCNSVPLFRKNCANCSLYGWKKNNADVPAEGSTRMWRRLIRFFIISLFFASVELSAFGIGGSWVLENLFTMHVNFPDRIVAGIEPTLSGAVSEITFIETTSQDSVPSPVSARVTIETNTGPRTYDGMAMPLSTSMAIAIPSGNVSFQIYYADMDGNTMWYQYSMSYDPEADAVVSAIGQDETMVFIGIMRRVR